MAKYADAYVCFWDGKSKGTADMIRLAKFYSLALRVINKASHEIIKCYPANICCENAGPPFVQINEIGASSRCQEIGTGYPAKASKRTNSEKIFRKEIKEG